LSHRNFNEDYIPIVRAKSNHRLQAILGLSSTTGTLDHGFESRSTNGYKFHFLCFEV